MTDIQPWPGGRQPFLALLSVPAPAVAEAARVANAADIAWLCRRLL